MSKGISRLSSKAAQSNVASTAVKAETKPTKSYIRRGGQVIARNPAKATIAGVAAYSGISHTSFTKNLASVISTPLDVVTNGGFSQMFGEIEEPLMMGVIVGAGLTFIKYDSTIMVIGVPAAVEMFLDYQKGHVVNTDPWHLLTHVGPAVVGSYFGSQVVGMFV